MTSSLVDAEARTRIAHDLEATLVVEAAAGTGKTTALVARILSLLRTGKATLSTLVAVTFTEKAAGEMKLRLRTEIEKARKEAEDPTEQGRLNHALRQLEAAHIGTIHAFCADMLRERPVEARVDPRFEVASEDESERLYDDAFTTWFQETLQAPGEGVSRVLRRSTRERDQDGPRQALHKAGRSVIEQRDFPTPYARPVFDRNAALETVIHRLAALATYAPKGYQDNWLTKSLHEIGRAVDDIRRREEVTGARDYDGAEAQLRQLVRYKGWNYTGGRTQWFNRAEGLSMQQIRDERAAAKLELDRVLDASDADLAALLFRELWGLGPDETAPTGSHATPNAKGVVGAYNERKARAGKLDFLDLLVLTRDLLRSDASVRAGLQQRFTHLLVDEFQDTDPLQADMLFLLAADDPKENDPDRVKVVPGKLFLVGDPKQSIYRFRRAEVALYETIKERLLRDGASLVLLRTSFRSAPSLQAFVNAAFETRMKPNARKSQASYVPLAQSRPDPSGRPTVIALPVPRPYSDYGKVTNWKVEESFPDAVGAFVDWLVNESGWTITLPEHAEPVKIGARHVCLLFKRLQSFGNDVTRPYVRALEVRRLPHVLVGGRSFHDREEIIALRCVLSAIEWPDDGMSVYAALRGPFFALSDDALLAFKHTQRHLHPLRKRDATTLTELTRPVGGALDELARLHADRNRRSIADTIARFLENTRAHAGVAIWPAGEQALGNILRVLDMARRFEQGSITSFRAFVGRLDDDAERGGVNEAPVVEEGTDGVRIMTVHKAKGLEFPVVVLVDPTANATFREPSRYVDSTRRLWAVPLCGASPTELLERRQEILDQDREESLRLLYVATTRARDLLVIPVVGDERDDKQAAPPPSGAAPNSSGTVAATPRTAGEGWLDALDPVLYPSDRRGSRVALGCPTFGEDTVLERTAAATRSTGSSVRPGLHRPAVGTHSVVFWDPSALGLDREAFAGQRQQKILAVDEKGTVAKSGIEHHAAWLANRNAIIALAAVPSLVVRTVTEAKSAPLDVPGSASPPPASTIAVAFESTTVARHARPHGARFGTLVHAMLAVVPLDGDTKAIADTCRIQARILGASEDEAAAARDAVVAALAHPLLVRARSALRVERETALMMTDDDDGGILEGIVDLAFLEKDVGWTVVDFKTDVQIGARKADYTRQIETYARAISAATGAPAQGALLAV